MGRSIIQGYLYGTLSVVVGIFMLFLAVNTGGGEVTCGSSPMEPGDICKVMEENGAERTYEEQKQDNKKTEWLLLGIGIAMFAGGAAWLGLTIAATRRVSRARGQAAAQAAGFAPGQAQQHPYPQQQYPPQPFHQQPVPPGQYQQPGPR